MAKKKKPTRAAKQSRRAVKRSAKQKTIRAAKRSARKKITSFTKRSAKKPARTLLKKSVRASPKKLRGSSKKIRIRPPTVKAESFTLDYPKDEPFRRQRIAPPEDAIELSASSAVSRMESRKRIPHALSALVGAGILTAILAAVFTTLLGADLILAAGVSLPLFVGFSILFFNLLESRR